MGQDSQAQSLRLGPKAVMGVVAAGRIALAQQPRPPFISLKVEPPTPNPSHKPARQGKARQGKAKLSKSGYPAKAKPTKHHDRLTHASKLLRKPITFFTRLATLEERQLFIIAFVQNAFSG